MFSFALGCLVIYLHLGAICVSGSTTPALTYVGMQTHVWHMKVWSPRQKKRIRKQNHRCWHSQRTEWTLPEWRWERTFFQGYISVFPQQSAIHLYLCVDIFRVDYVTACVCVRAFQSDLLGLLGVLCRWCLVLFLFISSSLSSEAEGKEGWFSQPVSFQGCASAATWAKYWSLEVILSGFWDFHNKSLQNASLLPLSLSILLKSALGVFGVSLKM